MVQGKPLNPFPKYRGIPLTKFYTQNRQKDGMNECETNVTKRVSSHRGQSDCDTHRATCAKLYASLVKCIRRRVEWANDHFSLG